nr:hypothetical protein [Streptomyces zinciresistens]
MPHRRHLPSDVLAVGARYPLVLAGACAVRAHGLLPGDPDDDPAALEMATESAEPMDRIAAALLAGLDQRGWRVRRVEADPLSARLLVEDRDRADALAGTPAPAPAREITLDLTKETLWHPPALTDDGPALSLEDLIGTKVRALTDRGSAGDLTDVHAAAAHWSFPDLEELGRRHAWDAFDPADLQARLEATEMLDDRLLAGRGQGEESVRALRRWVRAWADDIAERLLEEEALRPPAED